MERGRSRSNKESDFYTPVVIQTEDPLNEFIRQRSDGGTFALKDEDVKIIEEFSQPIIKSHPELASAWTGLVKDPNVSNAIYQNPSFQGLLATMSINQSTNFISTQNFLKSSTSPEGEDLEQADEIDDKDDVLTSNSSATISTPKRSPRSVSHRGPDDIFDSDDDDLGYSRTTHLGDYPTDDDPVDEGDSSEEFDIFESLGSDVHCPHCGGTRTDTMSIPKGIPIQKTPKRNRSTSTSSFGAGSPPQYLPHRYQANDQERLAKLSLGFVSLAIVVIMVHSMGNCKAARELILKSLPWLVQQATQIPR